MNERRQRRQATLQSQDVENSTNSRRPSPKYSKTGSGAFSTPVVRLSKWPKNVFFASDFIADKAAAAACRKRSTGKSSRGGAAPRCRRNAGEGKTMGRGSRAMGEEAPVTRMKENSSTTVFRTSGGGGAFQQHSVRSSVDGEARRDASVAGDEEAFFLEESASALLLLHSRFFGGARHEEDVVCSLCTLCREAGWMGNPLGVCPGLDPLAVEEIVMERLRRNHHTDVAWKRHSNNSGGSSRPAKHYTDDGFSFEDFYQTLADVAGLVYPREAQEERRRAKPGRAMYRLLTEGVLPLAEDNQPRHWSPRSEMLFGRPALAALRMQRDTLHELYCIYNKDTRARDGASGLNRNQFLKMLTDLGVSPVSVTEQHAASVFDDIIRNGLPVTGPSSDGRHSWGEGAIHEASDRGDYCLMGGERNNGVSSSSRKPGGGRLCWSLFLEAMAALAVGAVKNGQSVSPRRRRNGPASRPVLARPEEEEFRASAETSGGVRGRSPVSSGSIWERSPTTSAAGAILQVVAADGREEVVAGSGQSDAGPGRRTSSATSSVVSAGPKAKGGASSSEEASGDSRSRLSVIATADSAKGSCDKLADVQAATVNVNVPSPNKLVNTKDVAALSPAPCHGGSPSLEVSAASGGCSAPTCRVAADLGLPSPDVEQGGGTADVILRPDPGKHSAHHVAPRGRLCAGVGGAEGSYCSAARIESTVGRGGGENSKALQRGIDTHDDRLKSVGRAARADHITMDFEAAGCSVGLFEELLEPRVVATYSRHQKELLVLFQRYRTRFGGEQSRLPLSCGEETSGCVNEPGIWRFVSDFPVLRRWVQGDNILLLIVRASLQRGRQRCGKEHAGNAVGLSYFGFLEVLTRMAYAIGGQQPLHDKLLDLIHALRSEDPEGILT
ncbi:hypothetical protein Esi_0079_0072 [Ectocarpus siliculosus]|uniref:Uncharacterized protein n=1 Tax=Ectocarpus siliculosus TaxID=2880 RepID=D7G6P3_ECTSI|nr:hypothetical protein Esi_0079_0072 [Ectocarpus siliculosus]|eukprot:CBJ27628.1 hypothetical protein Esi_0079_0072 [Ectocarpus siliculosus]